MKSALRRSLFLTSLAAFAMALTVQPYRVVRVTGHSMEPAYSDGQFALAETNFRNLAHGDVVVIDSDEGPIVKRILRLPGDRVLEAKLPACSWREVGLPPGGKVDTKIPLRWKAVPAGYVFVLGDNLRVSRDSRELGLIPISKIRSRLISAPPAPHIPDGAWLPVLASASERSSAKA